MRTAFIIVLLATASLHAAEPSDSITVLYDSHAAGPLAKGWGYSVLIEYRGSRLLFDAGGSPAELTANAKTLGLDLSKLDAAIVSHDDSDHFAGLTAVPRSVPVYVPESDYGAFATSMTSHVFRFFQGLMPGQHLLDAPDGFRYVRVNSAGVQVRPGARLVVFDFADGRREQALLLDTAAGTVMVTGCAHPGIVRMVQGCGTTVRGIAGGMHLMDTPAPKIRETVTALKTAGVEWASPGHCTGPKATEELRRQIGGGVSAVAVGGRIALKR